MFESGIKESRGRTGRSRVLVDDFSDLIAAREHTAKRCPGRRLPMNSSSRRRELARDRADCRWRQLGISARTELLWTTREDPRCSSIVRNSAENRANGICGSQHCGVRLDPEPALMRSSRKSRCLSQRIGIKQLIVQHDDTSLTEIADSNRRITFDEREVGGLPYLD